MKKSTTGLLLGSALVVGLAGCATPNTDPSSDRPWYQQPVVCGIAGGLIGGSIGYATSGSSDEEEGAATGTVAGAALGAMLCADRSPEPVAEPEPMPEPEPEPVPTFEPVTLQSDVTFAFDSSELRPGAAAELNQVANTLRNNPEVRVIIAGHTDSVGSNEYNQGLSQRRADSVRDYLVSQGVANGRMRTVGYGEERPVATNETDEGRAMNRRVEISSQ
ncbi:OOP family OmpA-OmpF porin [Halomonas campaniensis]|uniref:OOP family OmpA-OmpF porin n=1 Tax=Halomonas campaniensis TaxID=213554 RepID=A0A7W5K255_9GAMM|nr:OmpA family protein [Halomonas campaniensis]MBB3330555.1 OOP family OmpA-OmpF porin [Halomonas campaniensis]